MLSRRAICGFLAFGSIAAATSTVALTHVHETVEHDTAEAAAVEAAAAVLSALAAVLVLGWFSQQRRLHLLVLGGGLTIVAGANLFLDTIPTALANEAPRTEWSALVGRCVGAAVIAVAALIPSRRVRAPLRGIVLAVSGAVSALALVIAVVVVVSPPSAIDGDRAVPAAQLVTGLLFAACAAGFARRAAHERDEFLGFIAVAAGIAAVARLAYALAPSLSPGLVRAADGLRVASFVVLSAAATREIVRYCRRLIARATADERERMGRDVHDRIAQELAYIVRHGQALQLPESVIAAAARALAEARRMIDMAQQPPDEPLWEAIARSTADVAVRGRAELALDITTDAVVAQDVGEALVRVVREAVINAERHGGARTIRVSLANGNGIRLSIVDDGRGFVPEDVDEGSFGLRCMRERVEGVGGRLSVTSTPGSGTEIEVSVP